MSITKGLSFVLPNRPGTLGKVTSALAAKGVNLLAIDASGGLEHNIVHLVPDKVARALPVLKRLKLDPGVGAVLCVRVSDKAGSIAKVAKMLGNAKINIQYLYSTGGHKGGEALVVLRTSDNRKAQQVLKQIR